MKKTSLLSAFLFFAGCGHLVDYDWNTETSETTLFSASE
jgi:hypothetical protein